MPLDGSAFAEAALPAALAILGPAGELVLTSVAPPPDHVERDDPTLFRRAVESLGQTIMKEDAVRQIGQRIVIRKIGELRILRDVFEPERYVVRELV